MENLDFYGWLKTKFNNLETAKVFYKEWRESDDGETPHGSFSSRAMAAHISNVLEDKERYEGAVTTNYITTKYGSEIFMS